MIDCLSPFSPWVSSFAGVPFGILRSEEFGTLPDWAEEPRWAVTELIGGGIVRDFLGLGPATVVYPIETACDTDARALRALMSAGTAATLILPQGITALEGLGTAVLGEPAVAISGVYLVDLTPQERQVDGSATWLATFERAGVAP